MSKRKVSAELAEKYDRSEKILLHSLTRRQREILLKENPLRSQRNAAIRALGAGGVTWVLLSRVTGLGECQIWRILKGKKGGVVMTKGKKTLSDDEKRELLSKSLEILRCGDKVIVDAFTARVKALAKLVKSEKKKRAVK